MAGGELLRASMSYNLHNQHKQISMEFILNRLFLKAMQVCAYIYYFFLILTKNPITSLKKMNLQQSIGCMKLATNRISSCALALRENIIS